tara:strand:+ start:3354 stop:4394 length:1041 start_codon:yes stop_codon:yes gene_type:complete
MKYIIYRNDGLGDLIVSTPLLVNIRKIDRKAKICLICSNRNLVYAKLLLNNGLIDEVHISVDKGKSLLDFISLWWKSIKFKPDYSLVLKSSNTNYLASIFSKKHKILGIVQINEKNLRTKETPNKILQSALFKQVKIDCRNNYEKSKNIKMVDHYKDLFSKGFDCPINKYSEKLFKPKLRIANFINEFSTSKLISNKNILIHLDEKWLRYPIQNNHIHELIKKIKPYEYDKIIITCGAELTKYNLYIFKKFDVKNDDTKVEEKDNIIFFKKLSLLNLASLITLSDTIITSEGGVSHLSSVFEKNLINLIHNDHQNFLEKWKPQIKNYHHIIFKDDKVINQIIDCLN